MSSQTHCWPRNNKIKKIHLQKKGGNSLNIFYVPPLKSSLPIEWDLAPTGWLCVAAVFKVSIQLIPRYRATGLAFPVGTLHFSSLYTRCERASDRKLLWEGHASSLRPPACCVNAYLVLCPSCGVMLA